MLGKISVKHCISHKGPKAIKPEELEKFFETHKEEIQEAANEFNQKAEIWRQRLVRLGSTKK